MNKTKNLVGTLLVTLLIATAVVANEKIADYRHHSMEAVEVHFQSIRDILSGDVPFEHHLSMHVNALADYAEMMPDLFAEGSEGGEALDRIWNEGEEQAFTKAVSNFKGTMSTLKEKVAEDDSDAIMKAVRAVGNACRDCHKRYRE
ncbi:MAG: cytochrome c [Gammaproteobacteria bacterium]|nr:cytochrome c [Gammaproteobacteria bacterium]